MKKEKIKRCGTGGNFQSSFLIRKIKFQEIIRGGKVKLEHGV
jgi:hypothetical protein